VVWGVVKAVSPAETGQAPSLRYTRGVWHKRGAAMLKTL